MGTEFAYAYKKRNNNRLGLVILASSVFLAILFCASVALAVIDVTLAWDSSSGSDGYRLFYREDGQNYDYTSPDWEGTGTTCTISGLDESTTYHFVVRAFNDYGESGNSNEEHLYPAGANQAPSASFTASPTSGNAPLAVSFNASSSNDSDGTIVSYSWTFGDGGTGTGVSPSHTYNNAGTYTATLTVTDDDGAMDSSSTLIQVIEPPASNLPPNQPVVSSPYDGEMETDLLLTLQTEPFSDPDNDTHKETQWQIVKAVDSSVVLEIVSDEHLTELPVPHAVLDRNTTYNASVQFVDVHSEPSPWSNPVEFTTHNGIVDNDGDGIPDAHEVDDTVDLNGDGTPDNDQPGVIKSVLSAVGSNEPFGVSKISTSIDAIEMLEPIHPADILDRTNKPETFLFGLASYRLRLNQVGATVQVRMYYSEEISEATRYYLYDTVKGWQDYTQYTTFNEDGRSVTVELQDGGHGDSDGVANGIIVDPGGVVGAATGTDSGASGGCFIATAKHTERNDWLKPIVRVLLMPLVGISYIVRTSLATIILLAFMLIVSVLSFYALMYKRRKYQV
jgi:PKD repeat protein